MDTSSRRSWIPAAILAGAGYALVGILFAVPLAQARAWRLAAWIVSATGYAAHMVYERRNPPLAAALHVALGVALGAFGLAVGANIHSLWTVSTGRHRTLLRLSLAIWPLITALPAFGVALAVNTLLARTYQRRRTP